MTELLDLAGRITAQAVAGEQLEAYVARGRSTSVKAYAGDVESMTVAESAGVGIRVVVNGRQGFAHCGTFDEQVIRETLAEARDNATFAEPDPWAGMADPDGVAPVEHDLWDDGVGAAPVASKVEAAIDLERRATSLDARVARVRTAVYADSEGEGAIVTSTGIAAWGRGTSASMAVSALAEDAGSTRMGVGTSVGRGPGDLDPAEAAGDAVSRAVRLLGAEPCASRRITIVLEPRMAATILGIAAGTLTGSRVLKGRSPFADRVGEAIASPLLTLVDDPTDARSLGADSHDGEGLACRRNVLLDGGVLQGFLHDTWSGRRSGLGSTASAVRGYSSTPGVGVQAMAVSPGAGTFDDLVASVDDGLLVASFSGLHSGVNAVSGDVSVGAEGLIIRDGVVCEPVREITLASTIQRLLLDIRTVGADLTWLPGGSGACTLVIDDVMLSGT